MGEIGRCESLLTSDPFVYRYRPAGLRKQRARSRPAAGGTGSCGSGNPAPAAAAPEAGPHAAAAAGCTAGQRLQRLNSAARQPRWHADGGGDRWWPPRPRKHAITAEPGFITTPIETLFRIEDRIVFEAQIPNNMKIFKAEHNNKAALKECREEFMQVIIQGRRHHPARTAGRRRLLVQPQDGRVASPAPEAVRG